MALDPGIRIQPWATMAGGCAGRFVRGICRAAQYTFDSQAIE